MPETFSSRALAIETSIRRHASDLRAGLYADCEARLVGEITAGHLTSFKRWRHAVSLLFEISDQGVCLAMGALVKAHWALSRGHRVGAEAFLKEAESLANRLGSSIDLVKGDRDRHRSEIARNAGIARSEKYTQSRNMKAVAILMANHAAAQPVKFSTKSEVFRYLEEQFQDNGTTDDIVKPESLRRSLYRSLQNSEELRAKFSKYSGVPF